jgi:hypothetical protein
MNETKTYPYGEPQPALKWEQTSSLVSTTRQSPEVFHPQLQFRYQLAVDGLTYAHVSAYDVRVDVDMPYPHFWAKFYDFELPVDQLAECMAVRDANAELLFITPTGRIHRRWLFSGVHYKKTKPVKFTWKDDEIIHFAVCFGFKTFESKIEN